MKRIQPLRPVNKYPLTLGKFVETRVNGGMYTVIDSADLENKYATDLKNMRVRKDAIVRRGGYASILEAGLPASSSIVFRALDMAAIQYPNGTSRTFLFTKDGVKYLNAGTWSSLATGWAMAATDRIQHAILNATLVFSTNGNRTIQTLSSATPPVLADAKASKTYKYITAFFNRIVAANFVGSPNNSIKVEWTADGDVTKWDGDDRTAGSNLLLNGPSDLDDEITGLKAINNRLFIWRKRSIWVADRQASGSAPFSFSPFIQGLGCDLPYTITEVRGGICWADTKTSSMWFFDGQNYPKRIGLPIEDILKTDLLNITSVDFPQGAYDPINNELYLLVKGGSEGANTSTAKIWIHNFDTEQFSYDNIDQNFNEIFAIFASRFGAYSLSIGELQGTIGSLIGTIGSLGGTPQLVDNICFSAAENIRYYNEALLNDKPEAGFGVFNSYYVQGFWQSKVFEIPTDDIAIGEIRFEYDNSAGENIDFYYSINGAVIGSVPFKTITADNTPGTKLFRIPLNVRCRQFQFAIRFWSTAIPSNYPIPQGNRARILKYEVHTYELGRSTI